jgi:hypothetical protein
MRVLILLECLVVLALSVGIVVKTNADAELSPDEVFNASRLLLDAVPNETATYRMGDGRTTLAFRVLATDFGGLQGPPRVSLGRTRAENGIEVPEPEPNYVHYFHRHGLFPFLTPEQPTAYDRVWILRRLQRATLSFQGRQLKCWKAECIDPGLPPDRDAVLVWLHEDAPVFGILRWEREGETWELTGWRPK